MQGFAIPTDAEGNSNRPICGLLACAFVAGTTLEEVTALYNSIRRERNPRARAMGKGWKGYSTPGELIEVLKRLGHVPRSKSLNDRTLSHFAKTAPKGWTFVVQVPRHFVVVRDGLIYDQGSPRGSLPDQHFCRRRKAEWILWVQPKG